ncbi:hypothetical protein HG530_008609 [Fusarium avenaceum]|nr:hypothetical protein HG530_008609 [Fusarium avenaceum]
MAGNLMAVFDHAADEAWPWCSRVVNSAFPEVSTGDVKGSPGVVSLRVLEMIVSQVSCGAHLEEIKKVFGVGVRPIIIRQSNVAITAAMVDGLAIRNTANFGSSNVDSIRPNHGTLERIDHLPSTRTALIRPTDPSKACTASLAGLLVLHQVLLVSELGVTQAQRESDKRDTQADTGDGKKALHVLVCVDHGIALGGSNGEVEDGGKRLRVGVHGKGVVPEAREALRETYGEDLRPDGAGDGVAKGRAHLVKGEVQTSHDGESLVGDIGLEGSLRGVREHTARDTEEDLGADDTGLVGTAGVAAVADEQTKGDEEEACTGDDENLEATDLVDDEAEDRAGDDTGEGVEGLHSGGSLDAKVEGHLEDGVEIIALHGPGEVEHTRDTHGGPDGAVLHVVEGNQGVRSSEFPDDEHGDTDEADDKRSDDLGSNRGDIADDDLNEKQDHGVADLVDDRTSGVGIEVLRRSLNNRTDGVEEYRNADKFDTTKDISDLARRWLSSSCNNRTEGIDRRLQRMLLELVQRRGLISIANSAVKTVGISD